MSIRCIFKISPGIGDEYNIKNYESKCGKQECPFISDLEHAEGCIKMGTLVQPCPKCLKIAREESRQLNKLDLSLKNELIKNSIKNEELEALAKYDQQKGVNHESKKQ